jgi:dienelactone hydrolase
MPRVRFSFTLFCLLLLAFGINVRASAVERIVDLTASDGTKLKATFFRAGKPGPGVLLLHQCNRQRKVWDGLAQQLAASGINVLTLDLRGFGESGGTPADKATPQEAQEAARKWPGDIDVAYHYLISQPGVDSNRIGAGGASCGVDNSIQTARRHPEVRSLVLLSGPTDLNGRNFLRSDKSVPVFFAYADDDEFQESALDIQWFYSITANPAKKLEHYTTGGHGADIFPKHPELPKDIVDWYVTTLIKTPGRAPAASPVAVPEAVQVLDLLDQPGGPAKVEQMLAERRKSDPKAQLFDEGAVNLMGYERLQSGDTKGAIEIFKLNVAAYPNSPNVYDSLGDGYFADGQKELVRQNSKKALELLPSDTTDTPQRRQGIKDSAEQKLKQLGDGSQ